MMEASKYSSTPPHYPTYNIHLDDQTIGEILKLCIPEGKLKNISKLARGKSFNNRMYFITLRQDLDEIELVLKVNGQFFDYRKVQNEVICLKLLQYYCPEVIVPRVIAWSNNGSDICSWREGGTLYQTSASGSASSEHGWILMTRITGESLDLEALSVEDTSNLTTQLAQIVYRWRSQIPRSSYCGNVIIEDTTSRTSHAHGGPICQFLPGVECSVGGILSFGIKPVQPMGSLLSYWTVKLEGVISQLSKEDPLEPNRAALLPILHDFVQNTLKHLPIFISGHWAEARFVFTHTDLTPQNILVSYNPLRVMGIVDFEFAGFYTSTDEFINELLGIDEGASDNTWPAELYSEFLKQLQSYETEAVTPIPNEIWPSLRSLTILEIYVAPWWLAKGGIKGEELLKQLATAREKVQKAISNLTTIAHRA